MGKQEISLISRPINVVLRSRPSVNFVIENFNENFDNLFEQLQ